VNGISLYWKNLLNTTRSLAAGLRLTFSHLLKSRKQQPVRSIQAADYFAHREGIATVQYPHVELPIPDVGRYKLHNEIDDCIVCDKCAVVCPVDCITIEPIRSPEVFGKTSDGTSKRIYAATFDIDMAKCCFCGLCTTVCPTECLTMTKEFDFSVPDISLHNFSFADMTAAQIADKKNQWAVHQQAKIPAPTATAASTQPNPVSTLAKPVFKPKIKPPSPPAE
jgi:formate hydrogenlyase subunit 6/NADH:ubiquinone oxidoreductase subunit I